MVCRGHTLQDIMHCIPLLIRMYCMHTLHKDRHMLRGYMPCACLIYTSTAAALQEHSARPSGRFAASCLLAQGACAVSCIPLPIRTYCIYDSMAVRPSRCLLADSRLRRTGHGPILAAPVTKARTGSDRLGQARTGSNRSPTTDHGPLLTAPYSPYACRYVLLFRAGMAACRGADGNGDCSCLPPPPPSPTPGRLTAIREQRDTRRRKKQRRLGGTGARRRGCLWGEVRRKHLEGEEHAPHLRARVCGRALYTPTHRRRARPAHAAPQHASTTPPLPGGMRPSERRLGRRDQAPRLERAAVRRAPDQPGSPPGERQPGLARVSSKAASPEKPGTRPASLRAGGCSRSPARDRRWGRRYPRTGLPGPRYQA